MRANLSKAFGAILIAVMLYGGLALVASNSASADQCNCPRRCTSCPPAYCVCGGPCRCCLCSI